MEIVIPNYVFYGLFCLGFMIWKYSYFKHEEENWCFRSLMKILFSCVPENGRRLFKNFGGRGGGGERRWMGLKGCLLQNQFICRSLIVLLCKLDTVSNVTEYTINQETLKLLKRVIMKDGNWEGANSHCIHILPSYSHIFQHPVVVD